MSIDGIALLHHYVHNEVDNIFVEPTSYDLCKSKFERERERER